MARFSKIDFIVRGCTNGLAASRAIRCNEQQRIAPVAGPPGLGNDKIQPKRGKVVRERVHVHIAHLTLQTVTTGQASLDWPPST
jgi:hypothetical protein